MKEAGRRRAQPAQGELQQLAQVKLVLVALFGIAAGLTVIWYTAQFQALYFLQNALRIEDNRGAADDRHRRDVQHVLVHPVRLAVRPGRPQEADRDRLCADHPADVPLFHWMAAPPIPELARRWSAIRWSSPAATAATIRSRQGPGDRLRQIARRLVQEGHRLYDGRARPGGWPAVTIGGRRGRREDPAALDSALKRRLQARESTPSLAQAAQVVLAIVVIGCCRG
jgi:hypothetical protein